MLVNDQQDSANNALHIAQQHHSTEVHHHHCCPNMASSKKQGVNVSDMASPAAMDLRMQHVCMPVLPRGVIACMYGNSACK